MNQINRKTAINHSNKARNTDARITPATPAAARLAITMLVAALLVVSCSSPASTPIPAATATPEPSLTFTPVPSTAVPTATLTPILETSTVAVPVELDGMPLVFIPAGPFLMGSTPDQDSAESDEQPQHSVTLDAFWIDQHEVTNSQYALCVTAGGCLPPPEMRSYTRPAYYNDPQFEDYPVILVSWDDAHAYCAWAGRRLPSEAEWEKAARGEDGQIFPWGDDFPNGSRMNFCDQNCQFDWKYSGVDDAFTDTSPVGSYPSGASTYGVLDMAGNVWEWVLDWFEPGYYQTSPSENPGGPAAGENRGIRGGSWSDEVKRTRSSFRSGLEPVYRDDNLGFRCARTP